MPREKHVFDSSMVAHVFASRKQSDGRNPHGNFFFSGDTIYSYGRHFPIAQFVTGKGKRPAILFTSRTYSNTTAGHIAEVRNAIRGLNLPVFHVWDAGVSSSRADHLANLRNMTDTISRLAKEIKGARMQKTRDRLTSELASMVERANAYSDFFALRRKVKGDNVQVVIDGANAARERLERAAAKRQAERAKEYAKRQAERAIELENDAQGWRAGSTDHVNLYDYPETMLRVINRDSLAGTESVIETSRGAEFPSAHGIRAFKLIAWVRANGYEWTPDGRTIHLGHFAIDSIEPDGTVHAGCHTVQWSEIERIAEQLGVTADAEPEPAMA